MCALSNGKGLLPSNPPFSSAVRKTAKWGDYSKTDVYSSTPLVRTCKAEERKENPAKGETEKATGEGEKEEEEEEEG